MNAATIRVQRFSAFDGSGAGEEGGPARLTPGRLDAMHDELSKFEEEMTEKLPAFEPLINGFYLVTEGGRLLMVGRFVQRQEGV